jgi:predicted nucleic acid-binding protein
VEVLVGEYTQILAVYEVLNAIWKYVYLLGKMTGEEAEGLVAVVTEVAKRMKMANAVSLEAEVLRVAIETGLTAYDASYVVVARRIGAVLVTEDRNLRRMASPPVPVASVDEL